MEDKMKVSLVVFTYNEIDGMKAVMPKIKKEWYDEIIIVDGGSTDGTIEYAKEQGYYLFVQKEKGAGAAYTESMEKVTGDITIIFSPDGNSVPEKIPELVEKIKEGYDLVIASRYYKDAKSEDDDAVTAFGNWLFTNFTNLLFGSKFTDILVIYRAFRTEAIRQLDVKTKTPSWGSMMSLRALRKKLKIADIPADEPARIGGKRKMRPIYNGICELRMILKEFFRR